jgi:hypothetical protein
MVVQGSPTITLTLKGFNFVRRSRVYFEDESVPYKRVSATELQVLLDPNLLARAGRFDIVVRRTVLHKRIQTGGDGDPPHSLRMAVS